MRVHLAVHRSHLRTEARQRQIRGAFSQYMSPHYVDELAAHPERLNLGGQARTMTIMFCDIRGFTSLSEKLDAESLTHFINSFLSPVTEIIIEQIEAPPANWNGVFHRRGEAKRGLPQRGQHTGADKRDPLIATVETSGVELRVFADHQILGNVAAAVDDDVGEPCPTPDLDIGQQHRAGGPRVRIDPATGKQ